MLVPYLAAALTLAACVVSDDRFVQGEPGYIAVTRMDPIVNPGEISGHVHQIFGASNFRNVLNSPADMLKAQCTSTTITADKSNYWTPLLYWINQNGTFSAMGSSTRLYYFLRNSTGPITPFPPGLRMVSGLAMRRDPGAIQTQGLGLDFYQEGINGQYLPNGTTHPTPVDRVMMSIVFPSCGWANQSLDSWDHFSHMTWPVKSGGGKTWWDPWTDQCPKSHPIRYPFIQIETLYRVEDYQKEQWSKTGPNFILSNGDVTGVTFHADFVNGWDPAVLADIIERCGPPNGPGNNLANCPAIAPHMQNLERQDCRLQGQIVDEDVGFVRPLAKLPGCNPRWDWDGPADKPPCSSPSEPGLVYPNLQYHGPIYMNMPLVLPGVDTSNPAALVPMTGRYEAIKAYLLPWATNYTNKGNVPYVGHSNQQQIDANTVGPNGKETVAAVQGTSIPAYSATTPTSTVHLTKYNGGTLENTNTFQCTHNTANGYLPCPRPTNAKRAEVEVGVGFGVEVEADTRAVQTPVARAPHAAAEMPPAAAPRRRSRV